MSKKLVAKMRREKWSMVVWRMDFHATSMSLYIPFSESCLTYCCLGDSNAPIITIQAHGPKSIALSKLLLTGNYTYRTVNDCIV